MSTINQNGWVIPQSQHKTYSDRQSSYYKLGPYETDISHIKQSTNGVMGTYNLPTDISNYFSSLKQYIAKSELAYLLHGPCIPFMLPTNKGQHDIGSLLEDIYFPELSLITSLDGNRCFKYILQGNEETLKNRLQPTASYVKLVEQNKSSEIMGYYFPLAFEGYAVSSQIEAIQQFASCEDFSIALSGPMEIASVLAANSRLLLNPTSYSHILCASGVTHVDNRLVLCFKSYGSNLEGWLLTKQLTLDIEQISEQWSGGITVYRAISN